MLLRGLQRTEAPVSPRRHPITADLLHLCIQTLRSGYLTPSISSTLECMFLLAFFGFLRCSEFTASSSRYDPSLHPSMADITFHSSESLTFTIKRSKTDQQGRAFSIHLFKTNSPLSPYTSHSSATSPPDDLTTHLREILSSSLRPDPSPPGPGFTITSVKFSPSPASLLIYTRVIHSASAPPPQPPDKASRTISSASWVDGLPRRIILTSVQTFMTFATHTSD